MEITLLRIQKRVWLTAVCEPQHDKTNKIASLSAWRKPCSTKLPTECIAKTPIRLGGCSGWSESSLSAQVILLVLSCCGSCDSSRSGQTKNKTFVYIIYLNGRLTSDWPLPTPMAREPRTSCHILSLPGLSSLDHQYHSDTHLEENFSRLEFASYRCLNIHLHMSRDMTKPTKWVCAQWRLRSAWASAQSDQSSLCA